MDLSCPCISAETACSMFNTCLSIFLEQDMTTGRVVVLDEAHKVSLPRKVYPYGACIDSAFA